MANKIMAYEGFIPPCGIYCGGCPSYKKLKNPCPGAEKGCKTRRCKGIYVCCIEKKGLEFCHQCKTYPCNRYRKFAATWQKYGQDLLANQKFIEIDGKEAFARKMYKKHNSNA